MNIQRSSTCPSCGASNLGIQERCLLCGAALPATDAASVVQSHGETAGSESACRVCHAILKPGVRFCTACGAPVAQ